MKIAKPNAEIASDKINIVITMPMCVSFHLLIIMSKSTPKKDGPNRLLDPQDWAPKALDICQIRTRVYLEKVAVSPHDGPKGVAALRTATCNSKRSDLFPTCILRPA
jgi:hypothetical protein